MQLWLLWWDAIWLLRPGCTHLRTFMWFAGIVAGLTIRTESLGVTSLVRALGLHQRFYNLGVLNSHPEAIRKTSSLSRSCLLAMNFAKLWL